MKHSLITMVHSLQSTRNPLVSPDMSGMPENALENAHYHNQTKREMRASKFNTAEIGFCYKNDIFISLPSMYSQTVPSLLRIPIPLYRYPFFYSFDSVKLVV